MTITWSNHNHYGIIMNKKRQTMYPSFTMKYLVSNGTEEWIDVLADYIDYDDEDGNPILIWKNKGCLVEGTSWKELGPSD